MITLAKRKKATLTLQAFTALAGRLVDRLPPRLARELNGGFVVLPETKRDGEFYIMGEYIEDPALGRFIAFYYGSFAAVLGDAGPAAWEEELWETVKHELRHHVEALAGSEELVREELAELARRRQERDDARGGCDG
ncbi:MAG: metallopeptidase family protein [Bacillota bacterium]